MWDIALKYAADWNSVKVSAAVGWTQLTDEGCLGVATCTNVAVVGGGGTPFQDFRQDGQLFQVGASILHVPSGLFAYGLYQNDQEDGTQFKTLNFHNGTVSDSASGDTNTWFVKAGIKRAWMPAGATVIFGEWGQYNDMFRGLCGSHPTGANDLCDAFIPTNTVLGPHAFPGSNGVAVTEQAVVTGSEVNRWGVGVVQEIDSAAMHLFARWQHLDLNLDARSLGVACADSQKDGGCFSNGRFGKSVNTSFEGLDIFQIGGVIFF
jgi:hypothetical protein